MKSKTVGAGSGAVFSLLMIFVLGMVHPLGAGAKDGAQLKIATKDGTMGLTSSLNSANAAAGMPSALKKTIDPLCC